MILRLLLGALLLCSTTAFAGKKGPVSDEVERIVAEAPANRSQAIGLLDDAARNANDDEAAWIALHAAEQRRLAGRADAARSGFEALLGHPQVGDAAMMGLALLTADLASGAEGEVRGVRVLSVFTSTSERAVLDSQNADRFTWLALRSEATGQAADRYVKRALELSEDAPDQHARIASRLARLTSAPDAPSSGEGGAPLDDLDAARQALARGDSAGARSLAGAALQGADADRKRQAERILRAADAPVRGKVGVLLPLTGRFGAVGSQVRDAVTWGWRAAGRADDLVFVDSGGSAQTAVAALEKLVMEHGVLAVIGPLLSEETDAVVDAADGLGVPLVALSQALEQTDGHPWVFQSWLTQGDQVDALVRHVMGTLGWTRFVVLTPDNEYGRRAGDLFAARVTDRDGFIVLRESYPVDATDFRPVARRIARRPRQDAPPVVDYEAIFVPDGARRVALVAAGLAFEEVPVGSFRPHDDASVRMLGLSGWNNHEILSGGGMYTQGALFTDVFVGPPDTAYTWYETPMWRAFVDGYREATGRTPSPVEALASDAGQAAGRALAASPRTRDAFRAALADVVLNGSATGATSFDPQTRFLRREIRILSVQKDGFKPVDEE